MIPMRHDLKSNEETSGDRPGIAAMKDSASDVAKREPGEGTAHPTVSVIIPTYTKARWVQGWGKAAMAHMDGFDESTSLERYYAVRTLPAGVGRGLADAVRGDVSGLGRSAAIVAAFSVTVGGYLWYQLESRFRKKASSTSPAATA